MPANVAVERVPMFHVRNGNLVRESGPRKWTPVIAEPALAVDEIKRATPTEGLVYVYDVDGVEAGAPDHGFYQRLERAHVAAWIQPGCRNEGQVMDAFFAGAEALTLEPRFLDREDLLELAALMEGEAHLGFPFRGTQTVPDMRPAEVARLVVKSHCRGVVLDPVADAAPDRLSSFVRDLLALSVAVTISSARFPAAMDLAAAAGGSIRLLVPWRTPARTETS